MKQSFDEDPYYWQKRAFDRQDIRFENQINSAIESGHHAVKASLLLNGAACIALLGFLASTISLVGSDRPLAQLTAYFIDALMSFSVGAMLAAVTAGLGYLTNLAAGNSAATMAKHFDYPYIRQTKSSRVWGRLYVGLSILTISTAVASYVFFALGLGKISGWH